MLNDNIGNKQTGWNTAEPVYTLQYNTKADKALNVSIRKQFSRLANSAAAY